MLFDFQEKNKILLINELSTQNLIILGGAPHSGKSYVVNSLSSEYLILNVKPNVNSLSSIKNSIFENDYFKKKYITADGSISVGIYHLYPSVSIKVKDFAQAHSSISKLFKKNCKSHKIILLIKEFDLMDEESQIFINQLINKIDSFDNRLKIIVYASNCSKLNNSRTFKLVEFSEISNNFDSFKSDVKNALKNCDLSEKEFEFLFKNIRGNISHLVKILDGLNSNEIKLHNPTSDCKGTFENLLFHEIDNLQNEEEIIILKFIAILEEGASDNDFAFLLNKENNLITSKLQDIESRKIIEKCNSKWDFTFELLKQIFINKSKNEIIDLYNKIVYLYSMLYPSKYEIKAKYAYKANSLSFQIYFAQHILQKIRQGIYVYDRQELERYINDDDIIDFINAYLTSKNHTLDNNYDEAIKILSQTETKNIELLLEKNLFISQCKIKSLDERERQEALDLLNTKIEIKDDDLKYRYSIRRISALVHTGEYREAKREFEKITTDLLGIYQKTGSDEILYDLSVIYRRCNNVLDCDLAKAYMEKAIGYFSSDAHNIIGYYIALCNYFAVCILNYDLKKAGETKVKIEELRLQYKNFNLPRKYIFENADILYEFFNKEICIEEAQRKFYDLVTKCGNIAERLFFASNYSIFLALSGKLDDALEILYNERDKVVHDKEGIYEYRIVVNIAIMEFIKDNDRRQKSLKALRKKLPNLYEPDYQRIKKRHDKIIDFIEKNSVSDVEEWVNLFKKQLNGVDSIDYYGKPFIFTVGFNWDDD